MTARDAEWSRTREAAVVAFLAWKLADLRTLAAKIDLQYRTRLDKLGLAQKFATRFADRAVPDIRPLPRAFYEEG